MYVAISPSGDLYITVRVHHILSKRQAISRWEVASAAAARPAAPLAGGLPDNQSEIVIGSHDLTF